MNFSIITIVKLDNIKSSKFDKNIPCTRDLEVKLISTFFKNLFESVNKIKMPSIKAIRLIFVKLVSDIGTKIL